MLRKVGVSTPSKGVHVSSSGEKISSKDGERKKLTPHEYRQKMSSLFPLPPKPDEMCHDAFIKQVLKPFVLEKREVHNAVAVDSSDSSGLEMNSEEAFRAKLYQTRSARGTMMPTMIGRPTSILSTRQRDSAAITKQMFQVRYGNLISDFRNVCIIYQLLQLQEILNVMREYPPAGTNPNETIFVWSYKKNLNRFEQHTNTVYVDILEKNKSEGTLDDLKFYVDLGELIKLVQALLTDVVKDRDLCGVHGFMELLRDTQVDIESLIAGPYETIMAEHDSLVEEDNKKNIVGKFHNPKLVAKQRALNKEQYQIDYMSPIESRYKVNWAYDNVEQGQHIDFLRCKVLSDELEELAELTRKDFYVWQSCQLEYVTLIEQYKNQITNLQIAYDEDMEAAENMVQATANKVNKCKDDLKAQMDTVDMFHKKIQEVRDKLAAEAEAERARLSAARPSKRLSRILARQKAEAKEAKKQEKRAKMQAKREAKALAKELAKEQAREEKEDMML